MKIINWACPRCGCRRISMRTYNAVIITPISGISEYGDISFDVDNEVVVETGYPYYYGCEDCNYDICIGSDDDFLLQIKDYVVEYAPPTVTRLAIALTIAAMVCVSAVVCYVILTMLQK